MTKRPSLASSMNALAADPTPDPAIPALRAAEAPSAQRGTASTRVGMKRLLTPVTPELHKRLKLLAVKQDTTLEALTRAALESYLSQHDINS